MYLPDGVNYVDERAERVRRFCYKTLRHSDGKWKGKPFDLLPWQWEHVVKPIFGRIKKDGTRLTRKAGIWVSKKNGKSELAAALGLYMLIADEEPSAEVYLFASDRDQASLICKQATKMVKQHVELAQHTRLVESRKRIAVESTHSFLQAEDSDAGSAEGLNAHCIIIDELHAQKKRDLFDSIRYAGAARKQPLSITISTAGYDRESIAYEEFEYAKRCIADPSMDPTFHGVIYGADAEDDWASEAVWEKANPSLDVTIDREEFRVEFARAKQLKSLENTFRRYRLNQWTQQASRWINFDDWLACAGNYAEADLEGQSCIAGLDLASKADIAALVLLFPAVDETPVRILPYFWVPEDITKQGHENAGYSYANWVASGHLQATPGNVTDYGFIRKSVNELGERFRILDIGFDPWNASHLIQELMADGFDATEYPQRFGTMNEPTKEWERMVLGQAIQHTNNPVMNWMMDNVEVITDSNGNIRPKRPKHNQNHLKIDGVVAGIMALGRSMVTKTRDAVFAELPGGGFVFG